MEALRCEVCNGESGGTFVGVGALTTGPMSVAFCNRCLAEGAEPAFVFDYLLNDVAGGEVSRLHESVLALRAWINGQYVSFADWCKENGLRSGGAGANNASRME
jgi:hypothetical protein